MTRQILLAITGASGTRYAQRFAEHIIKSNIHLHLLFSEMGEKVAHHELESGESSSFSLLKVLKGELIPNDNFTLHQNSDLFATFASGSNTVDAMVVLPCSMGTLGRINAGVSSSLLERAADVIIKQKKKLVLCPRETPLSPIHLRNMSSLSNIGVNIVPPMPGFYQKPTSLDEITDFVAGKVCEVLDIEHDLYNRWSGDGQ